MPEPRAVFISYSHQDASTADAICERLEAAGVSCWIAPRNIEPGTDWSSAISAAIQNCSTFVLMFSSSANASRQVAREVHIALDSDEKKVIPLRLEAVEPSGALQYLLSGVQWLDGFEQHRDSAIASIAALVHAMRSDQEQGTQAPVPIREAEVEPPNNLPYQLTRLIGRDRELQELHSLVASVRLVTVVGPAGIGKTRCTLEAARASLAAFPSGVWLVEFAAIRDGQRLAEAVLAALGVAVQANRDPLESLIADLKPRRALLVFDNCEQVVDACARLADAVLRSCREVSILATSRERLDIVGERVYPLQPLSVPPPAVASSNDALTHGSVALFVERASSADPTFELTERNVGTVAEICRRLDGIALALELAAARVPQLGLENLAAALTHRFRVLSSGSRAALPRQQTLQATIDWSYDLLSPAEQKIFRTLGVFPASFSLDASAAVAAQSRDVPETLGALVTKSLVVAESLPEELNLLYRLLESFREYARAKLEESNEFEAAMGCLVAWCLQFVSRSALAWKSMPSQEWESSVRPELENIRSGLAWTLEDGRDVLAGQRIAARARRIWGRLAPAEGQRWIQMARCLAPDDTPPDVAADLMLAEAQVDASLAEHNAALPIAHLAAQAFEALGTDPVSLYEARMLEGYALAMVGRIDDGKAILEAVLDEYRRLGERALMAQGKWALGTVTIEAGDLVKAAELLREALAAYRAIGSQRGVSIVSISLAELEFRRGNVDEALTVATGALGDSISAPDAAMVISNIAKYLIAKSRWDEAREHAAASIRVGSRAHAGVAVALSLKHIASIAASRGGVAAEGLADAARLMGFADARLAELKAPRSRTFGGEDSVAVKSLQDALRVDEYDRLVREGGEWDETIATRQALAL